MKRKGLAIAGLVAGLSVLTSMTAFAGQWLTDDTGWWYQNDDGSYTTNNWQKIKDDDGVERWYLFDEAGYIRTGFWEENGYTYLLRTEGMCTMKEVDPSYQDDDGVIYDWGDYDVNPYPGAMVTGHYKTWPDWFYFNDGVRSDIPEGAMIKDCTITLENGCTATYDAEGFWIGE